MTREIGFALAPALVKSRWGEKRGDFLTYLTCCSSAGQNVLLLAEPTDAHSSSSIASTLQS